MIFAPPRTRGPWLVAVIALAGAALGIALLVRGATSRVSFAAYLSYTLGALLLAGALPLAYWAYAAATLSYRIAEGAVRVHWGFVEHVVPLGDVERVILGRHLVVPRAEGIRLPGVAIGRAFVHRVGRATVYLRYRGPEDILYLKLADGAVGLSVPESRTFVAAMQQAQQAAPARPAAAGLRRFGPARLGFLADRTGLALAGLGLLLSWASAGVVYARYRGIPAALTLHFPSTEAAHLGPRGDLLHIPEAALAWFAVATLFSIVLFNRARAAAYLLLAGSAVSGVLFLIAAVGATG